MIATLIVLHLMIAVAYVLIGLYLAPRFVIVGPSLGAQIARVCLGVFFVGCALTHIHDAQHIRALVEAHDNAWQGAPYLAVHGAQAVCGWSFFFLARRFLSFRIYNIEHYEAAVDKRMNELVDDIVVETPTLKDALTKVVQSVDDESTPKEQMASIIDKLDRISAEGAQVAENLAVAQKAVDGVADDLAASHARADDTEGPHGAAADAASQSPTEEP